MTSRGYTQEDFGRLNSFAVEPEVYVDESLETGFTENSEKTNGRWAMIGFAALLATEALLGQGLIPWLQSL